MAEFADIPEKSIDVESILADMANCKPSKIGSLNPIICWLSNIVRAIRYRNKKHIPVSEFIRGLECKWKRPVDTASAFWFRHHQLAVDILYQILSGKGKAGNPKTENAVTTHLLLETFLYTPKLEKNVFECDDFQYKILDSFSKYYPDAGFIIMAAFVEFWDMKKK